MTLSTISKTTIPSSYFSIILGLSGLGQAWRVAHFLWDAPAWIAESILLIAFVIWFGLLVTYITQISGVTNIWGQKKYLGSE